MKFYIGTSGWQYGDWRHFYPKTLAAWMFLPFYVHSLNSVEINVSFYRMVRKQTFENWANVAAAASGFRFAVKLNNHFTREKRLNLDARDIEQLRDFFDNASGLSRALGPVLVQLPPGVHCDLGLLENFLKISSEMGREINSKLQIAMEFRHKSWLNDGTYNLLKKYGAAFVISDCSRWPTAYVKTADFVYVRLHGKPRMFYSLYKEEELEQLVKDVAKLKPRQVFIYFNNTMYGHAAENALDLKNILVKTGQLSK